jgi:beta-N-acetylhexosaminidase
MKAGVAAMMIPAVILAGGCAALPAKADTKAEMSETQTETTSEHRETAEIRISQEDTTAVDPAELLPAETDAQDQLSLDAEQWNRVQEIMSTMTLHEKVCQMFFVNPEQLTGVGQVVSSGQTTRDAIAAYPVGGIMYSKPNLQSGDQVRSMIAGIQSYSRYGLFIAADEEGGIVNRLMSTLDTTWIDSMYNYKDQGTDRAYENACTIAADMAAYGFNLDFAPVADVWSNPENTVIGKRAYSDNYEQAAELVGTAADGFHAGGVLCTLKHFPGHGDTAEDSHYSSAYVKKSLEELKKEEFLPFESGISHGADFVMVGHLIVPDVDEVPATLSKTFIEDILRGELGFQGIVITDALQMSALAGNYSSEEIAVRAVQAGNDMLLEPADFKTSVQALEQAVVSGTITEKRIDQSVARILFCKIKAGIVQ